jgi:hypothetical protein
MACEIQASGAIELYFYRELDADARRAVSAHLASCRECRGTLDELGMIEEILSRRARVSEPPDRDWAPLMARIASGIEGERLRPAAMAPPADAFRRRPMPAYLAMAALLALVTASVGYLASQRATGSVAGGGRLASQPPLAGPGIGSSPSLQVQRPASGAEPQDPEFAAVSEQLFDRSKLVILGLASRDPQSATASDWGYERQLAGTLLEDTRLYKQAAEARGLGTLAGVMSDLELVLLQASLADQSDATTLDRLQRLIRKRDLVSRIEMRGF